MPLTPTPSVAAQELLTEAFNNTETLSSLPEYLLDNAMFLIVLAVIAVAAYLIIPRILSKSNRLK